jgi:hypothetical protein
MMILARKDVRHTRLSQALNQLEIIKADMQKLKEKVMAGMRVQHHGH